MSGCVNKVMLMGNLTRDVELKVLQATQTSVAKFGLAMNRHYKRKDGQECEEVTFIDCEAFGKTAEIMSRYLSKGRPVFIEGRLRLDRWETSDGQKRSKVKVVVENFQFVGDRESEERTTESAAAPAASPAAATSGPHQAVKDEEIPF